jgi:hypothetical protein
MYGIFSTLYYSVALISEPIEPMPLKSHFSCCLLNNIGLNKFVSCGKFEIYAVCLLNAIGNERKKAEEMSQSG